MTDTNNQDKNKTGIQTPAKDNQNPGQAVSDKEKTQDQNRTKSDAQVDEKKDDSGKENA